MILRRNFVQPFCLQTHLSPRKYSSAGHTLIFEYVYDPFRTEEDKDGRVTVAGLARTCQAFRDPALDVLWAQLHSLDALVLCSGGRRDGSKKAIWDRALYDADWRILARYTGRVHTLTISHRLDTWDITTMQLLSCHPLLGPLLPNLAGLSWLSNCENFFPFLRCFCGPNLTTLRLSPTSWSVRKCAVVASLAPLCPLLKKFLCIDAEDSSMQAVSEAVVGWKKLQVLLAGPLNEQALTHASSLETLQELRFSVSDLKSPVLELCSPRAAMTISTPSPSLFHAFTPNVHFSTPRLRLVCQHYDEKFPKDFFSRLKSCLMHPEELLELRLVVTTRSDEEASNRLIVLDTRMLHPLLSLKGLDHLDLGCAFTFIDDTFLKEMALSCPRLQKLYLGHQRHWSFIPVLTFEGVTSLLMHCRQLSSLGIFFDATFKSDTIYMAPVDAVSPKITEFLVGASCIDDPVKVTAVLSFLFPNATHIDHCIPKKSFGLLQEREANWEAVNKMLNVFVSARQQSWGQGWLEGRAAVESKDAVV
ncbi:uncharacterized protein EDB91DRAFT_1244886 [Suillus paluster]|uniref:uncharacterized protein n=1 Tax=Suillus paluster TaxID=48578 RepID=UPI001B87253D|nr:uncharacterized protein EDB91DRAFT_1244886 [Suillus paluster]KAG1749094.1 hypothetical protein EDB91DRAFT_1244886 [Suillus paluster]